MGFLLTCKKMLRRGRGDASTGGVAVFLLLCCGGPGSRAPTDFDHELAEIHFVLVKPIWGEAVSLHTVQLAEARRQTDDALIAGGPQGPCGTEKGQHPSPPPALVLEGDSGAWLNSHLLILTVLPKFLPRMGQWNFIKWINLPLIMELVESNIWGN